ncbi:hypothetical protein BGW42_003996 [Actinomortierella wolfii]|nr:hypothetical protein BGW42_003996 [Actinomortierella wolfii]
MPFLHSQPKVGLLAVNLLALCLATFGAAQGPINVAAPAVAQTKSAVYIAGGFVDVITRQLSNQFYKLDLTVPWTGSNPAWKRLANGPSSAHFAAAFTADEKTMVTFQSAGGVAGGAFAWLYSVEKDTWTTSKAKVQKPDILGIGAATNPATNLVYMPYGYSGAAGHWIDEYSFATDTVRHIPMNITGAAFPGSTFSPVLWSAKLLEMYLRCERTVALPSIYNLDTDQWVNQFTPPSSNVPSKPGNNTDNNNPNNPNNPNNNTGNNNTDNSTGNNPSEKKEEKSNTALIVGLSAGAGVALIAAVIFFIFLRKRRHRPQDGSTAELHHPVDHYGDSKVSSVVTSDADRYEHKALPSPSFVKSSLHQPSTDNVPSQRSPQTTFNSNDTFGTPRRQNNPHAIV